MPKKSRPCPMVPSGRHRFEPMPSAWKARYITHRCECGETATLDREAPPVTVRRG